MIVFTRMADVDLIGTEISKANAKLDITQSVLGTSILVEIT